MKKQLKKLYEYRKSWSLTFKVWQIAMFPHLHYKLPLDYETDYDSEWQRYDVDLFFTLTGLSINNTTSTTRLLTCYSYGVLKQRECGRPKDRLHYIISCDVMLPQVIPE